MNESIISVRYTKAIFATAKDKNAVEAIKDDMEHIFSLMNESEELQMLFQNPILKPSKKMELVKEIFREFNSFTISFINLLIKNRREEYLHQISRDFLDMFRKYKGIEDGQITTAVKIPADILENIKKMITTSLKKEVELKNRVDENIIGGLIIQIGDKQYDASVKTGLDKMKRKLLNTSL